MSFLGDIGSCAISTYNNIASCTMERKFGFLLLVLYAGDVRSFCSLLVCLCVTGAVGGVYAANSGERRAVSLLEMM